MDEERRTTVNLKACLAAASDRVVFINTGFLGPHGRRDPHVHGRRDRWSGRTTSRARPGSRLTRITTSMSGSPAACRAGRRSARACGPMPDKMADMLAQKSAHPKSRRQHGLGALAHRRDAARLALSRDGRVRPAARTGLPRAGETRRYPDDPARAVELPARRRAGGTRQQRSEHPRLRRALGGWRCRLLEGARHPRCRADGGSRDAAHLQPAHCQLAPPRGRDARSGSANHGAHGGGRRSPECL